LYDLLPGGASVRYSRLCKFAEDSEGDGPGLYRVCCCRWRYLWAGRGIALDPFGMSVSRGSVRDHISSNWGCVPRYPRDQEVGQSADPADESQPLAVYLIRVVRTAAVSRCDHLTSGENGSYRSPSCDPTHA
jgi:hypothetical protein